MIVTALSPMIDCGLRDTCWMQLNTLYSLHCPITWRKMKLPICIRLNWMRIGSLDLWRNQKNLVQPWYTRNAERISTKNTSNSEKEKNNIDLYHWTTNPNIVEWLHGDDANVSNNEHYSNAKVYISSQERLDRVNSIIGRHP
ncbi:hypothetical protein RFI_33899 [Reticulomyxa filosa]|uniref:Uncharacterized protein n=1 Tax=Reticulomyxa filosa TaxID=46433 RepID=X6LRY0_RETFI|nr:hypothetical protein RFI_33899 [Reticulomyxa filosa]|eukprot:ETO03505.1 hypothetical protein RFI_33899 [Reticulomyxa filosa]